MIKVLSIVTMWFLFANLMAQQIPMYNQYMHNPFLYNPSMAGTTPQINTYIFRSQRFMGFDNGSVTNALTTEGSFRLKAKKGERYKKNDLSIAPNGIGMFLYFDKIGVINNLSAKLAYSRKFDLIKEKYKELNIRLGLAGGIIESRIDFDRLIILDPQDPYLLANAERQLNPDADFGVSMFYNIEGLNVLEVGISVPQLLGQNLKFSNTTYTTNYRLQRHYMLYGKYNYLLSIGNMAFTIEPSVMLRYIPDVPFQYDVNLQLVYKGKMNAVWIGGGYKSNYAAVGMIGFHFKDMFKVGYSYEYIVHGARPYAGTNHEFFVGISFNKYKLEAGQGGEPVDLRPYKNLIEKLKKENQDLKDRNDALNDQLDEASDYITELEDSITNLLRKKPVSSIETKPEDQMPDVVKLNIEEVDGSRSPEGYYLIVGAYSSEANARKTLNKAKGDFPNSRVVYNADKGLYYTMISYGEDRSVVADDLIKAYKSEVWDKVWILVHE